MSTEQADAVAVGGPLDGQVLGQARADHFDVTIEDRARYRYVRRSPAYSVRYVPAVTEDGDVVPLRGGAFLEVVVRAPVLPTDEYFISAGNIIDTSSYRTFRQVDWPTTSTDRTPSAWVRARGCRSG